jgi:hypothetical protein
MHILAEAATWPGVANQLISGAVACFVIYILFRKG